MTAGLQRAHFTDTTATGQWGGLPDGQGSSLCPSRATASPPPPRTLCPQGSGVFGPEAVQGALCSFTLTDLLPRSCDSRAAKGSLCYHRGGDTQSLQARQLLLTNIFSPLISLSAEIEVYQQLSTNIESCRAQSQCIHTAGLNYDCTGNLSSSIS